DEKAHSEAHARKHGHAVELQPTRPLGQRAEAEPDSRPNCPRNADLLAEEEPAGDAERDRLQQARPGEPLEAAAGIAEGEHRQDEEDDRRMERVLEPMRWRLSARIRAKRYRETDGDARERRVDAGLEYADPEQEPDRNVDAEAGDAREV